jgi:MerR family transcriptional regulator, copper efflux regulator
MLLQEKTKQIGTIAKESGVPIKTIRYYEELGLLKATGRTEGGFRLFNSEVLARLNFIKRAQSLGLSLLEIKDFLGVHDRGELPCDRIEAKLQAKVTAIDSFKSIVLAATGSATTRSRNVQIVSCSGSIVTTIS